MRFAPRITFAHIAGFVTIICSAYGIATNIYGRIQANREDIQKTAIDRIIYRGEQARFKDSVRRAINLLDKKAHLDPTFPK